jgi:hypothetical protein
MREYQKVKLRRSGASLQNRDDFKDGNLYFI